MNKKKVVPKPTMKQQQIKIQWQKIIRKEKIALLHWQKRQEISFSRSSTTKSYQTRLILQQRFSPFRQSLRKTCRMLPQTLSMRSEKGESCTFATMVCTTWHKCASLWKGAENFRITFTFVLMAHELISSLKVFFFLSFFLSFLFFFFPLSPFPFFFSSFRYQLFI